MGRISRRYARLWQMQLVAALLIVTPVAAQAQSGRIAGTVSDAQSRPIHGAQVSIAGTRIGALTNAAGQYVVTGVPAGSHDVRISHLGYSEVTRPGVSVAAGQETRLDVRLEGAAIQLGAVVVSAGRQAQRLTDAPATVTRIDASVIENSIGNTWAGALKQAVGLDFIQVGMSSVAINARGFNSSFNNRMLMMEDGRIAVLPENGLPVGQFTAIPKVDLAGVEVVVGPGAALYGADASNGVLTLQSKDPRQFPGTTVEVTGGNRSYKNVQARHAGVFGGWGYKVTGEWQDVDDWSNRIRSSAAATAPWERTVGDTTGANWQSRVLRGQAAVVRYLGESRFEVSAGASETDGVGQTNVGRNQLVGWQYNFAQAKFSTPRWFFNAYRAQSKAGDSYAINRYTDNRVNPANASKSDDEIRLMSDWPSNGRLFAAEVQNNFRLPALLNSSFVWGAQLRRDIVSSDREWLSDRLTGEDLQIDQRGVYGQIDAPLMPWLNLIFAARYDDHQNYDAQFSPKAGIVLKPAEHQAVRVTYNRAFKSPSTLQTDFFIPDFAVVTPTVRVGVFGNTRGFTTRAANGTETFYSPLVPEENQTWEVGYKGVLGNRLFLDVAGYRSRYENFLSPLTNIGLAYQDGALVTNSTGDPQLVFTYFNLGRATVTGADAGVNYFLSSNVSLKGTFSWLRPDSIEVPAGREEATSLNAPNTKWTLGASATDIAGLNGGALVRHVTRHYFRSGINMGMIPTFTTLDANLGYQLPWLSSASLQVGVSNLFTCSQKRGENDVGFTYDLTPNADPFRRRPLNKERECGFGVKHQEMINMPALGTMLFVGMRYNVR
jgi:outer membrane receptor for ferrienterochelin and colicins